jgi:hypothetical protein
MTRRKKIVAGLLLALLVIIGAGIFFQGPNSAEAKVFERLMRWAAEMPDYDFDDGESSKPRMTVVNGNTVWFKVAASTDSVERVLDFYETQFPAPRVAAAAPDRLAALAKAPGAENVAESARLLSDFIQCLNGRFRLERPNWGVWGAFVPYDQDLRFGEAAYVDEYTAALESGHLGEMGTARMVVALKPPRSERTRIFSLWTTRDFNLNAFRVDGENDFRGSDIETIPRFPNTRRLLSLEQHNARTIDTVAIYESGGSEVQLVLFFNSRMPAAGWQLDNRMRGHLPENGTSGGSEGRTLFFTRNNRECVIQIHRSQKSGRLLTTIIDRTTQTGQYRLSTRGSYES